VVGEEVFSWIKEHQHLPFVLYVHYNDPHVPYWPPLTYYLGVIEDQGIIKFTRNIFSVLGSNRKRLMDGDHGDLDVYRNLYQAEVEFWDRSFEDLMIRLEQLGITERTMIIVVADHGEEFLDHGLLVHGTSLYEELIHVPMIVLGANVEHPGEIKVVTVNLDVMPTILEYLGMPLPKGLLGRSLMPLVNIDEGNVNRLEVAYSELPVNRASKRWGLSRYYRAGVLDKTKLIEMGPDADSFSSRECYRLDRDPFEKSPLSLKSNQKAKQLIQNLDNYFEGLPDKKEILPPDAHIDLENLKVLKALGYIE